MTDYPVYDLPLIVEAEDDLPFARMIISSLYAWVEVLFITLM